MQTLRIFFLAAALGASSLASANDIVGTWTINSEGRRGPQESTLVVRAYEGKALAGTFTGPRGNNLEIAEIKTDGNSFFFKTEMSTRMGDFTLNYSGKISGDSMDGSIETPMGSRTFTGQRKTGS